ncbi:hypothetical protein QJS10_CPB13g00641 [Acorus calamus]|uniref:HIT-type domain-containing protein n=1 Tax=Acorus calamus TaxID=4465 RepID=A0AAV9DH08_ACOCL|nr:hypothetical protein QJS10_CPB13g00641 [Acorus calamus]
MAEPESTLPNHNPNLPSPASTTTTTPVCQVCGANPPKYTCPGCSARTCGLACVRSHKLSSGCTGKRNLSQVVPISRFDDNLLVSDYNFLEETKRLAESAKRGRDWVLWNSSFKHPWNRRQLRDAAGRRRTRLFFFPIGLSKREKNESRYDERVNEHENLCSVVEKHLKLGPRKHKLTSFCKEQLDQLKFFIRKNSKVIGTKSPFLELNIKAPIRQQLANVLLVEYPVIHVFLPSHSLDFIVEKRVVKFFQKNAKPSEPPNRIPSPRAVLSREEEIEEDNDVPSETRVLDMEEYVASKLVKGPTHTIVENANPDVQIPTPVSKDANPIMGKERRSYMSEETNTDLHCKSGLSETNEYVDLLFENDLKEVYSNLVDDLNLDDYLCLDGGFIEEGYLGLEEGEELEEGEIPSF